MDNKEKRELYPNESIGLDQQLWVWVNPQKKNGASLFLEHDKSLE